MRKKVMYGLVVLTLATLTGCGQEKVNNEMEEAVQYYENLGIEKEDAEDLAEAIVGNGNANNNVSEESSDNAAESTLPVVDIMPEIANGTMNDYCAQFFDMLFRCDLTMTPEEVKKVIDDSEFDFTYEEKWCECGTHAIINLITLNDKAALEFDWQCSETISSDQIGMQVTEVEYRIAQQKTGCFLEGVRLAVDRNAGQLHPEEDMQKNFHVPGVIEYSTYFTNRDDVLAFAQEHGCVESSDDFDFYDGSIESLYYNSPQFVRIRWVEKVMETDEKVKGVYDVFETFYQGFTVYRNYTYTFQFEPDGTISSIFMVRNRIATEMTPIESCNFYESEMSVVYGPKID